MAETLDHTRARTYVTAQGKNMLSSILYTGVAFYILIAYIAKKIWTKIRLLALEQSDHCIRSQNCIRMGELY